MLTVYRSSAHGAKGQTATDLRPPNVEDWQKWKPIIVARYRSMPARLFVREKGADGLRVTWCEDVARSIPSMSINDKNVRRDRQKNEQAHDNTLCDQKMNAGVHSSLDLPREIRPLHQALQGLQHWSDSSQEVGSAGMEVVSDAIKFHDYLWDMKNAIRILEAQRMCSSTSVNRLNQASNRLLECFPSACIPLVVLLSMQAILELRLGTKQDSLPWSETTSTFLLQVTANHFVRSHSVSMLIHLLTFGKRIPHELAAIYEAGRVFLGRYLDRSLVLRFRTSFFQTMFSLGLDSAFESKIEALSVEASDPSEILDGRVLCDLAHLRLLESRFEESEQLARTCLLAVQIHNDARWIARQVLRTLASVQASMNNYEGAEVSLLQALQLTTSRELDDASALPVLSSSSMMVVDDLREFYKRIGEKTKYEALCLRYPSAFDDQK